MIESGQLYQHYSGRIYRVLHLGVHVQTQEEFVVYHNVEIPEKVWIRPREMFEHNFVDVDGKKVKHFSLIRASDNVV